MSDLGQDITPLRCFFCGDTLIPDISRSKFSGVSHVGLKVMLKNGDVGNDCKDAAICVGCLNRLKEMVQGKRTNFESPFNWMSSERCPPQPAANFSVTVEYLNVEQRRDGSGPITWNATLSIGNGPLIGMAGTIENGVATMPHAKKWPLAMGAINELLKTFDSPFLKK